jgi:hypothetical protein
MLSTFSDDVANCYRHAAESYERAQAAANEKDCAAYIRRENEWLLSARTFQFAESMGGALEENNEPLHNGHLQLGDVLADGPYWKASS